MKPRNCLIFGASGQIGRNLIRGLTKKNLVAVACGANINFDRLRFVAERAELGECKDLELGTSSPYILDEDGNKTGERIKPMGVSRDVLVPVLIKAVQELSARISELEGK